MKQKASHHEEAEPCSKRLGECELVLRATVSEFVSGFSGRLGDGSVTYPRSVNGGR